MESQFSFTLNSAPRPALSPLTRRHLIRPSATFAPSDAEKEIETERVSPQDNVAEMAGQQLPAVTPIFKPGL